MGRLTSYFPQYKIVVIYGTPYADFVQFRAALLMNTKTANSNLSSRRINAQKVKYLCLVVTFIWVVFYVLV